MFAPLVFPSKTALQAFSWIKGHHGKGKPKECGYKPFKKGIRRV